MWSFEYSTTVRLIIERISDAFTNESLTMA
jgi:hypothetical protein